MSNTIHLPIKRKWFDMIASGVKKEEYREIKKHWVSRLVDERSRAFFAMHRRRSSRLERRR